MLLKRGYWELRVQRDIVESERAIARRCEEMVRMDFGMGNIVEGVLRWVPVMASVDCSSMLRENHQPLDTLNTSRC